MENLKKMKKKKKCFIIDDDENFDNKDILADDDYKDVYEGLKEDEPMVEDFRKIVSNKYNNALWKPIIDDLSVKRRHDSESETSNNSDLEPDRLESKTIDSDFEPERESIIKAKDVEKGEYELQKNQNENLYKVWQKGSKQVNQIQEKISENLINMEKPLTRYADDSDLDKLLRAQIHEDDPFAHFMKQKDASTMQSGETTKPKFKGTFAPNRFNIPPGYRWDAVDRSNGFESNWFKRQATAKAIKDIAYKWSTEDL